LFDGMQRGSDELFDRFYPGFDQYGGAGEEATSPALWSTSPAFQLLAEDAEREEWARLRDDEARAAFVERFWTRRDANASTTANELRADVARRIAFADRFFSAPNELRGSMSDRGRVFVLLGPPARVHRKALQRYETTIVTPRVRSPLTGTLERWVYFQSQLPDLAVQQVEFQFITQPGYGEYVMQRDFWPLKALAAAREPRR
jgi:GWxTD domain-containing protein